MPAPARQSSLPVPALAVLAASVFAAITTEVLPVGLLPQISRDLSTTESRAGLLVSAYAVVVAFGSVPLTALVSRWPRRRVLGLLLVGYALSNALLASTSSYPVALLARLLGGLAHAGFFSVVIAAAVSVAAAEQAGRAVTAVMSGTSIGLAFGVPLGTALGAAVGWRWAFLAAGGVLLGLAGLTALVLPDAAAPRAEPAAVPVLVAIRQAALLAVAVVTVLLTLGHYTVYTYISVLLLHAGVRTAGVSAVLFGYGLAGFAGLAAVGAVVNRHAAGALRAVAALTLACLLVLGLDRGSAVPTVLAVVLWGAAFGGLPTLIQTAALRAAPRAPDAAPAVVNATFNVGIAGGALLGGRELLVAGPAVVALTGAALVAVASALLLARR